MVDDSKPETILSQGLEDYSPQGQNPMGQAQAEQSPMGQSPMGESPADQNSQSFDLQFDQGVNVDQELLGNFQQTARDLGLNQSQAQKLADFYANTVSGGFEKFQHQQMSAILEAEKTWVDQIKQNPDFKADLSHAQRALTQFGSPELTTIMDETRIGSHPALFNFVAKVGRALAEPGFKGSGASRQQKPLEFRMWPGMAPGK